MKKGFKWFLVIGLWLMMLGCITDQTPENRVIRLNSGESQTFEITSDDPSATINWSLDREEVAFNTDRFTFTAEQNSTDWPIHHRIKAKEDLGDHGHHDWHDDWHHHWDWIKWWKRHWLRHNAQKNWVVVIMPDSSKTYTFYRDTDGDGYGDPDNSASASDSTTPYGYVDNSDDCDDDDADINPDATEVCDQVDNDCNGEIDEGDVCVQNTYYKDTDGDGYGDPNDSVTSDDSNIPDGYVDNSRDCDDDDAAINPGATEVCDQVDNNCSGAADEGDVCVQNTYYKDTDGDGYGDPNDSVTSADSSAPDGYVDNSGDCNDSDAAINPGATEVCDQVDNNCSGAADEGDVCAQNTYYKDTDGDGYGDPNDSVTSADSNAPPKGYVDNSGDCNDSDATINPGATEVCDQVDNNCSGEADEGDICAQNTYYKDTDGDGYGDPNDSVTSADSNAPDGYVDNSSDCNDNDAAINPGATEVCDQVDNNCSGEADEGDVCVQNTYYRDADGDGYGDPNDSVTSADSNAPEGYVDNSGDCNDLDAAINPDAEEVCDDKDNNCSGEFDEGEVCTQNIYYRDADGDGYGDPNDSVTTEDPNAPDGYVVDSSDCNDDDPAIHPGAEEVCDEVDNNCSGEIDEGDLCADQNIYYRDADGDGYGDPNDSVTTEDPNAPDGYVVDSSDCNDDDPNIHPNAEEVCDEVDNNCSGETDEGDVCADQNTYYRDADGDGYGNPDDSTTTDDTQAPDGYVVDSSDCNDDDPNIHPGVEDIADTIDNDCDGEIDEDGGETLLPPANVSATDIDSGLFDIEVTWDASDGATYYNVYRAIWEDDAQYDLVAEEITDTSYLFVQDWQTDVYEIIGPTPAMAPDADEAARAVFAAALEAYREQALPTLFNFKAPAFFKIEACNAEGCSEMSDFDAGQAEFIHTADESELAQLIIPSWGYPLLVAQADSPPGAAALGWCGIDICGAAEGMVMGRLDADGMPQVDIYYENYVEGWDLHPNARFWSHGYIGGEQQLIPAMSGVVEVSGECDISLAGINAHLFAYSRIGGTNDDNTGYISLTYNGETHQYTLPVQPVAGQDYADPPVPTDKNDEDHKVKKRDTAYPVPFSIEPNTDCSNWTDDKAVICNRVP
jgi:hypothetical protein